MPKNKWEKELKKFRYWFLRNEYCREAKSFISNLLAQQKQDFIKDLERIMEEYRFEKKGETLEEKITKLKEKYD